jgi:hypothetical protein
VAARPRGIRRVATALTEVVLVGGKRHGSRRRWLAGTRYLDSAFGSGELEDGFPRLREVEDGDAVSLGEIVGDDHLAVAAAKVLYPVAIVGPRARDPPASIIEDAAIAEGQARPDHAVVRLAACSEAATALPSVNGGVRLAHRVPLFALRRHPSCVMRV